MKDLFQVFDQLAILSRSEERVRVRVRMRVRGHLKDEGCHSRGWSRQQIDNGGFQDRDN